MAKVKKTVKSDKKVDVVSTPKKEKKVQEAQPNEAFKACLESLINEADKLRKDSYPFRDIYNELRRLENRVNRIR